MKVFKTANELLIKFEDNYYNLTAEWDSVFARDDAYNYLKSELESRTPVKEPAAFLEQAVIPPIGSQEIWASGVTYYRSRKARMEESKSAGGGDFYDRVYQADRPELFFKSTAYRARGHRQEVRIRADSNWNVPEPELTLVISKSGNIIGYTIGNDMSSRDIEGENPLYLPQAKSYDGSASIGPCVLLTADVIPRDTRITLEIERAGKQIFLDHTDLSQLKRSLADLVSYLYREMTFPAGCYLMTGTGIIPPDEFSLQAGDSISITIEPIGTLINTVADN